MRRLLEWGAVALVVAVLAWSHWRLHQVTRHPPARPDFSDTNYPDGVAGLKPSVQCGVATENAGRGKRPRTRRHTTTLNRQCHGLCAKLP